MVNRFTLNGVTYTAKPFTFGLLCDLEQVGGVDIKKLDSMSLSLMRGYLAVCADVDIREAEKIIEKHLANGGQFDDLSDAMAKEMEESDFFRSLSQSKQTGAGENYTESQAESGKKGRKPREN